LSWVEITVSARNTEVSPALREAVEEKLGRLARKSFRLDRAIVHFSEERNPRITDREVCEVTLDSRGHLLRCRVTGTDTSTVVDKAAAKLEQQLEKAKTKVMRRRGAAARRSVERRQASNGSAGNSNGRRDSLPKAI
jgi:putative sigma-54 modulation protein